MKDMLTRKDIADAMRKIRKSNPYGKDIRIYMQMDRFEPKWQWYIEYYHWAHDTEEDANKSLESLRQRHNKVALKSMKQGNSPVLI